MPKSRPSIDPEQPLYVRWAPDLCPYALEMRLDLIGRLQNELDLAEKTAMEVGGLFLGVFPTPDSPTLRLDDLVSLPWSTSGTPATGPELTLDEGQQRRFSEMVAEARRAGHPVVGFFRNHLRRSPMTPAMADVIMLRQQFPEGIYALLLIGPRIELTTPREAAFFLAMNGQLPTSPSSPAFLLAERTFQSLPELPAEATEDVRNFNFARRMSGRPMPWAAVISFALLMILIGTWIFGSRISELFRPASNQIDLSVAVSGRNLRISWDHATPAITKAYGATLVIMDGREHRELKLDSDDLRLGQVAYERLTKKVYVVMRIDSPDAKLPPQTFDWIGD